MEYFQSVVYLVDNNEMEEREERVANEGEGIEQAEEEHSQHDKEIDL